MRLGNIFIYLNNYEQGIFYGKQCLKFYESIKDKKTILYILDSLVQCYDCLHQYSDAIYYEKKRLELAKDLNDEETITSSLAYLGYAYMNLKDYAKAIIYLLEALELQRKNNDKVGEEITLYNLVTIYKKLEL